MTKITDDNVFKSGIWYTFSNIFISAIGFFSTSIFSRLLTKEDFGLFNNYTSWLSIILIIVTLNLEATLISAQYDYSEDYDCFVFSILSLSTFSSIFWFMIFNVFSGFFSDFLGMNRICINSMMLYLVFLPSVNIYQTKARYKFEYKKNIAVGLTVSITSNLLSILLVLKSTDKLLGRIIGSILPTVIIGIVFWLVIICRGHKIKFIYWKYALSICLPFVPHLLSLNMLNAIDRIMITRLCGPVYNAEYSLAYSCGSVISLLLISMNGAFAPWLGEKLHSHDYKSIYEFSTKYLLIFSFISIGIFFIAPDMLLILGGKSYSEARFLIPPIFMGGICQFLYTMFVNIEQFKKKTMGMAAASLSAALINYFLNLIYIPKVGYIAAAYTTLVGYLSLLIIHMCIVNSMKLGKIYNYRLIFCVLILGIVLMFFMTWIYTNEVFRYILIGVYSILLVYIIKKKKISLINIFKSNL